MTDKNIDVTVSVRVWDETLLIAHARKSWIKDQHGDITEYDATERAAVELEAATEIDTVEHALFWLIDPTSLPGTEIIETNTTEFLGLAAA